jgi:hypothetical protein
MLGVSIPEIEEIGSLFTPERITGALSSELSFRGSMSSFVLTGAALSAHSLTWQSLRVDTAYGELENREGGYYITRSNASFSAGLDSLASYFSIDSVRGYCTGTVEAAGAIENPVVQSVLTGHEIGYGEWIFDTLGMDARYDGEKIVIDRLDAIDYDTDIAVSLGGEIVPSSRIHGALDLSLSSADNPGGKSKGTASINAYYAQDSILCIADISTMDIQAVSALLADSTEIVGRLSSHLKMSGTLKNPSGSIVLDITRLSYGSFTAHAVSLNGQIDNYRVEAEAAVHLDSLNSIVHIDASLPLDTARFLPLADAAGGDTGFVFIESEHIDFSVVESYLPENVALKGAGEVHCRALLTETGWIVQPQSTFSAGGSVVYTFDSDIVVDSVTASVLCSGLVVSPYLGYEIHSGAIRYKSEKIEKTAWIGHAIRDGVVLDSGMVEIGPGARTYLAGAYPLTTDSSKQSPLTPSLECTLRRLPLVFFNPFIAPTLVFSRGKIKGNCTMTMKEGTPQVAGAVSVDSAVFDVEGVRPGVGPVSLGCSLRGSNVIIDTIDGKWGEGDMAGNGSFQWTPEGIEKMDIDFRAKSLKFSAGTETDVAIDTVFVRAESRNGRFPITAFVLLGPTLYFRPVRFNDLASVAQNMDVSLSKEPPELLKKIDLDIDIRLNKNVTVETGIARGVLDGWAHLSGSAADPDIDGVVRAVKGHVYYLDRKFTLTEAVFRQLTPAELNPDLTISMNTEIAAYTSGNRRTYTVYIEVVGDMDNPEVTLYSTPPLDEVNIVSLLTLGRIRSEEGMVRMDQESMSGQVSERVQEMASRQVSIYATRQLEEWLNLDNVTIEGNLFQYDDGGGPTVSLTKELGKRLSLTYQTVVGRADERRLKASVKIAPFLFLDGETDGREDASIDLRTRLRF